MHWLEVCHCCCWMFCTTRPENSLFISEFFEIFFPSIANQLCAEKVSPRVCVFPCRCEECRFLLSIHHWMHWMLCRLPHLLGL